MIPDWPVERKRMVERQLRGRGIRNERVLRAALVIPREEFVPVESRVLSYHDDPVNIGFGQAISQPYMTAHRAECLKLRGTETVLDVGAGSGYSAALLEQLRDPGRLVIPVGPMEDQALRVVTNRNGKIQSRVATLCRFVPLRGLQGWQR
jgi:protein-L-isoaspartate O-methyltransferase